MGMGTKWVMRGDRVGGDGDRWGIITGKVGACGQKRWGGHRECVPHTTNHTVGHR